MNLSFFLFASNSYVPIWFSSPKLSWFLNFLLRHTRCTRSDLVWGGMWTTFLNQYGGPYDALSLVHLYFVAATCCWKCAHGAKTLLSLILSHEFRLVWIRQNSAAATMIFTNLTVSHEANYCGDLSPRLVVAIPESAISAHSPNRLPLFF